MRDSENYNKQYIDPPNVGASCGSGSSPSSYTPTGRQLLERTILDLRLAADRLEALNQQLPLVLNYAADQGLYAIVTAAREAL